MKSNNILIAIFLLVLTLFSGLVFAFSYSGTNLIINNFYENLDQKGFWLNPGNTNTSVLKEEDVYKGNVTYPNQNDDSKFKLGITQPNGYYEINVDKKVQKNSIFIVKTTDSSTGALDFEPATFQDFTDALASASNGNTLKMDICVSKLVNVAGTNYDHFCGISIYED